MKKIRHLLEDRIDWNRVPRATKGKGAAAVDEDDDDDDDDDMEATPTSTGAPNGIAFVWEVRVVRPLSLLRSSARQGSTALETWHRNLTGRMSGVVRLGVWVALCRER